MGSLDLEVAVIFCLIFDLWNPFFLFLVCVYVCVHSCVYMHVKARNGGCQFSDMSTLFFETRSYTALGFTK